MASPTIGRRLLGMELGKPREQNELTMRRVAEDSGLSEPTLGRVENGQRVLKQVELRGLLDLYGVRDPVQQQRLQDMAKVAAEDAWWDRYDDVLPSGLGSDAGLEAEAVALRSYSDRLIHGLLQMADRCRAVIRAGDHRAGEESVESRVRSRMQRQEVLRERRPPLLRSIIDESAIRRPIGGATMAARLRHLAEAAGAPDVPVQVVLFSLGAHAGVDGHLTLLEFDDSEVRQHVYVESPAGNILIQKRRTVAEFRERFDRSQMEPLSPQESSALIEKAAEKHER
ncbi:helix-turn-helix transcriptional regulator [Nocardiopsis sp. N85]|uniref:helix-turn-helix domain-containing protein n=1 Tax=Nocardiopsis sp. N85 TaxID=3029400 RepID=UPI00237F28CB|nr:helix-turn-helix transcriptional regulator [Nocardiopsis sp. N85]MDE3724577.1 helix-turn-helix transcriptional regulator [Nocardiopsis sp. N85]